jgi:CPA2 family monovalent cation:H+ antiporter-2
LGALVAHSFGWSFGAGLILGIAISVASTVVLTRVLIDNELLNTTNGRIAVGWLVVEDIFTVLVLVLLPPLASTAAGIANANIASVLLLALGKIAVLAVLMLWGGARVIPALMAQVARTRSRELFTLTVLVLALGIAVGSWYLFGASMALGAFLAGMVVGQSDASHQAAADALPLRDAFAVLFFVSVGMLFNPVFLIQQPLLVISVLSIVLIGKPLAAFAIVWLLKYPVRTALTVALSLAQIGEFSFIVAAVARTLNILPGEGRDVLVAAALLSIALNPLLFRLIGPLESWLQRRQSLWRMLNRRVVAQLAGAVAPTSATGASSDESARHRAALKAVVVGYGPVGKTLTRILNDFGIRPTIVDTNIDTIRTLTESGASAIFGDATRREILKAAGIESAQYLLVTLPDLAGRFPIVATASAMNRSLKIFVRARYLGERAMLEEGGATAVAYEESEVAVALAAFLLRQIGASEAEIAQEALRIRSEHSMRTESKK